MNYSIYLFFSLGIININNNYCRLIQINPYCIWHPSCLLFVLCSLFQFKWELWDKITIKDIHCTIYHLYKRMSPWKEEEALKKNAINRIIIYYIFYLMFLPYYILFFCCWLHTVENEPPLEVIVLLYFILYTQI